MSIHPTVYSTHFTLDFSTTVEGEPTTEDTRREIHQALASTYPLNEHFHTDEDLAIEHGTATAESDWPPEGDDGYEQAFFDLSLAFPNVALRVFGWGADPLDAWQTSFAPDDVQFATASVETPRHVVRTGEHPECPACGYTGAHTLYFEPRIFRASLQPDLSVEHHGLVSYGAEDPIIECGRCCEELDERGLSLSP